MERTNIPYTLDYIWFLFRPADMSKTIFNVALFIFCHFILLHLVKAQEVKYKLDESWPIDSSHFSAPIFSVAVNQYTGSVFVAKRDKENSSILLFAQSGDYIQTLPIKSNTLEQVHGLTFHADTGLERDTLWATDVGNGPFGYTVKQYDLNGGLLRVLGTPGTAGSSLTPLQFGNVAEVAFDNKGLMYVVDGDGGLNNRLVKLNSNYSELWSFGQNGTGPLDFRIPHSVTVSPATGHIWVADRMNNRLKVFDPIEPKLVKSCQMDGGQPYSVRFSKDGSHLIVTQLNNDTIAFVSSQFADQSTCKKLGSVKLPPGSKPHLVDVDKFNGAFYVGNIGDPPSCLRFIPSY